jgi:Ni,Fe-hydrogenase maturation factor
MKVLVLGNPLLKNDSLPLRLLPLLEKKFSSIEFVEADPADVDLEQGSLVIIDTAKGIKDVMLIEDADRLQDDKMLSVHGLGLAEQLALLKAIGRPVELKIICVPEKISSQRALEGITKMLRAIVP